MKYDPMRDLKAEAWCQLDEDERIAAIVDFHRRANINLPNLQVHARLHSIVETQICMNDPHEVRTTLARLRKQQLHRHDAIHAIGCVLCEFLFPVGTAQPSRDFDLAGYRAALKSLTKQSWYRDYLEGDS